MITREELESMQAELLQCRDAQLKLQNRMDELKAKLEEEELEQDWPIEGDEYYYIDSEGDINHTFYGDDGRWDVDRQSIGNVFKTEEEAKFEVERLKVMAELKKFARPFVENDRNFILEYYHDAGEIALDYFTNKQYGDLHFETEEKAQEAIEAVGAERIKKYYFGVVD